MTLSELLAKNIIKTQYENLPEDSIKATKRSILDTIGVMLPPTTQERACIKIAEISKEIGGKEESTLLGFGGKVPCWAAAWVNGSLTHALDYDDTTDDPIHHPTAYTLPAALAVAEKIGNVSGKDFITAVALGNDLSVRLASGPMGNLMDDYQWFPITMFGAFSAAAAPGKLLNFSEEEMLNTLGITLSRVFGITEVIFAPGSEIRAIRDGFSNREGVLSALMAGKGISANKDPVESLYKFFYRNEYDPEIVTSNLGKRFRGAEASLKPWPACRGTHSSVQAAIGIYNKYDIDPDQIEDIVLTVDEYRRNNLCEPLEAQRNPKLSINAKSSIPFSVATALAKGRIVISDYFPENLTDPQVLMISNKVRYNFDPGFGMLAPAFVEIKTKDGKIFSERIETIYGSPQNPLEEEDIVSKFKDCAQYSRKPLSVEAVEELIEVMLNLEECTDIKKITDLLN
jgi:2-methylcitrate dehydratase PrpD